MAYAPVDRLANKSTGVYTPVDRLAGAKASESKSTLGGKVLGVAKDIAVGVIKPVARVATNVVNSGQYIAGKKETQPFSGKFLGEVKPVGMDNGGGFSIKNLKDSFGVGAEIGSNFVGGGVVKNAAGAIVKPTIKKLAIEGALGGGTYGLGQSLEEDKSLKDTVVSTALGAGIGAVVAPVLSRTVSYVTKKIKGVNGKVTEVKIPEDYTPLDRLAKLKETPQLSAPKPVEPAPIALGGKVYNGEVTVKQAAKNPVTVNPKTGKFQTTYNSGGEIISSKTLESTVPGTVPNNTIPNVKMNTNIPETGLVAPKTKAQRLPSITGNRPTSEAVKINADFVKRGLVEIPPEEMAKYHGFTEADQIERISNYMSTDPSFSENVANGRVPKDVVPQIAYNAVKAKADKEGDVMTQWLLGKNPITSQRSQAGSTLRASQVMTDKEMTSGTDLIIRNDRNIADAFKKKNGIELDAAIQKEVKTIVEKKPKLSLKNFIENIKEC
jgi:hypothetical protein